MTDRDLKPSQSGVFDAVIVGYPTLKPVAQDARHAAR